MGKKLKAALMLIISGIAIMPFAGCSRVSDVSDAVPDIGLDDNSHITPDNPILDVPGLGGGNTGDNGGDNDNTGDNQKPEEKPETPKTEEEVASAYIDLLDAISSVMTLSSIDSIESLTIESNSFTLVIYGTRSSGNITCQQLKCEFPNKQDFMDIINQLSLSQQSAIEESSTNNMFDYLTAVRKAVEVSKKGTLSSKTLKAKQETETNISNNSVADIALDYLKDTAEYEQAKTYIESTNLSGKAVALAEKIAQAGQTNWHLTLTAHVGTKDVVLTYILPASTHSYKEADVLAAIDALINNTEVAGNALYAKYNLKLEQAKVVDKNYSVDLFEQFNQLKTESAQTGV